MRSSAAGVAAAGGEEVGVGAPLDDPTGVEDDDLVHPLEPDQAMGDGQASSGPR